MFEKVLEAEGTTEADWVSVSFLLGFIKADHAQRAAMQAALTTVLQHSDLIARCDHVASQTSTLQSGSEYMQEDLET
jgi:mediator of RNA polymerase II transcription subunit 5